MPKEEFDTKIFLIILAIFAFLLLLKVKITIAYADKLTLTLTILGIPFHILPAKQKKVHIWRYSLRRMRRREQKQRRARQKKSAADRQKAAEKKQRKAEKKNQPKPPLNEIIDMILALVKIFFSRFGRHLHIDITRIKLNVAGGDAAQTAILWGAVCPTVAALLEILDRVTNLRQARHYEIAVVPDFVSESFTADICIAFSLRVWHLFDIAIRTGIGFLKNRPAPLTAAVAATTKQQKPKSQPMQ